MAETFLTVEQSREVDRFAVEALGISSLVLMENAGRGVVDLLMKEENPANLKAVILCGAGNNGGDGFVIARHLAIRGTTPLLLLLSPVEKLSGDALANYNILLQTNVPIHLLPENVTEPSKIQTWLNQFILPEENGNSTWLIDAMLGTGVTGAPRMPLAPAIEWFNSQQAKKLAVDIPSGLNGNTGKADGACVSADCTCTFVAKKVGFQIPATKEFLGEVHVLDIGLPEELVQKSLQN